MYCFCFWGVFELLWFGIFLYFVILVLVGFFGVGSFVVSESKKIFNLSLWRVEIGDKGLGWFCIIGKFKE